MNQIRFAEVNVTVINTMNGEDTLEAEATNFLSALTDTSVTQSLWPCDEGTQTRAERLNI